MNKYIKSYSIYFIAIICCFYNDLHGFKIDRVILSSNENRMYLDFWPLVARAWSTLIGIKPTLFLIAPDHIQVDESVGEVIRIKPIEGVSTASHAQLIRLLAPIYFENEISIISDIDMLPLNKSYFIDSVAHISDNKFVVYRDLLYGGIWARKFPMCYNAGKGIVFKELFGVKTIDDIPTIIKQWFNKGWKWETDERILHLSVCHWKKFKTHCVLLGHGSLPRIDRTNWKYDKNKLKNNYYIDSHMVRPLTKYFKEIKELADDLGLPLEYPQ